jgi:hypothetical protein
MDILIWQCWRLLGRGDLFGKKLALQLKPRGGLLPVLVGLFRVNLEQAFRLDQVSVSVLVSESLWRFLGG